MNNIALRVHNVGKLYQLGKSRHGLSLRETIAAKFAGPQRNDELLKPTAGKARHSKDQPASNQLWALRNISLEIKKGETVGIIGPNGSGKSTLLKILAEITEPTEGDVFIDGRLTALIELGAGFHPELSGRENIYLNGTILGLSKQQIDRNFDQILDFAELRNFIDTPLKHYSSGMTVRLGFSLAVHADPDILVVDEVLAVGDASFRRRCYAKIDEFIQAKKTIVIVTHNLAEAQRVAQRLVLIHQGQVVADGLPDQVIGRYANVASTSVAAQSEHGNNSLLNAAAGLPIYITEVRVTDGAGNPRHLFRTHTAMQVQIHYFAREAVLNPIFRVQIYRGDGVFCHGINTERQGVHLGSLIGEGEITLDYPNLGLVEGDYGIHAAVFLKSVDELPEHQWPYPLNIQVESAPADGRGVFAMPTSWTAGTLTPDQRLAMNGNPESDRGWSQHVCDMDTAAIDGDRSDRKSTSGVICIIGMHRSGTSMVARLLSLCGLYLGPEEQLFGPNEGNPEGHFEHSGFLQIDEQLLGHFGGAWESPPRLDVGWTNDPALINITTTARALIASFPNHSPWGWKEPRTTILLEFWKSLVPNLRFVICVRNPLDVAKSLANRNGLPVDAGIQLWHRYMRDALNDTVGYPVAFTFYDDYFVDAEAEIQRLARFCRLPEPNGIERMPAIITGELRHHTSAVRELLDNDRICGEIKMLYLMLRSQCRRDVHRSADDCHIHESVRDFLDLTVDLGKQERVTQLENALNAKTIEMNEVEFRLRHQLAELEQMFGELQQRADRLQIFSDAVRQTFAYRLYKSVLKPLTQK